MFWSQVISLQMQPKPFNTLRPRQNGCHFVDDTFKRIFMNENVRISINISLKFVPKGLINNIPALVQIMAWRREGDKPLSEPMMVNLLTHICVTRPQCGTMLHRTAYTALFTGQIYKYVCALKAVLLHDDNTMVIILQIHKSINKYVL